MTDYFKAFLFRYFFDIFFFSGAESGRNPRGGSACPGNCWSQRWRLSNWSLRSSIGSNVNINQSCLWPSLEFWVSIYIMITSRSDRSGRPRTRETSTAGFNLYSDHGIWKIEGVGFMIIYSEEKLLKNSNLCPSQIHEKQREETTRGDVSQVPWILLSEIISKTL